MSSEIFQKKCCVWSTSICFLIILKRACSKSNCSANTNSEEMVIIKSFLWSYFVYFSSQNLSIESNFFGWNGKSTYFSIEFGGGKSKHILILIIQVNTNCKIFLLLEHCMERKNCFSDIETPCCLGFQDFLFHYSKLMIWNGESIYQLQNKNLVELSNSNVFWGPH